MKAIILDTKSTTQFHFGTTSLETDTNLDDSSEICHSDTLWSAIVDNCAKIDNSHTRRFIDWSEQGRIRLSSTFFCVEFNNSIVYFLPKPAALNLFDIDSDLRKKAKKIKYISKGAMELGLRPKDWFYGDCIIIQDKFVALKNEIPNDAATTKFYQLNTIPKTKVSYRKKEGNFYHQTNVQLCSGDGFQTKYYFLIEHSLDSSEWEQFLNYLKFTLSYGLGGELSTGCGKIDCYKEKDFNLNISNHEQFFSCSLSLPESENEKSRFNYYQLLTRGGKRIENGKSAKIIEMLQEGAVFSDRINGGIADLTPENAAAPIKRCGMPLLLPLHENYKYLKEEESETNS